MIFGENYYIVFSWGWVWNVEIIRKVRRLIKFLVHGNNVESVRVTNGKSQTVVMRMRNERARDPLNINFNELILEVRLTYFNGLDLM